MSTSLRSGCQNEVMGSELVYVTPPCLRAKGHLFDEATNSYCVVCGFIPKALPHSDAAPPAPVQKSKGFNGSAQRGAATRRVVKLQGRWCQYCTVVLVEETTTIDHVIPLVSGGAHTEANWVICCVPCNRAKGEMSEDEFRASPFLLARQKMVALVRARGFKGMDRGVANP